MSFYEKTGTASSSSTHRRTWDTTEFQIKANERQTKEREEAEQKSKKGKRPKGAFDDLKPPPPKKLLEARAKEVDLNSRINKHVVVNKTSNSADTGGFYCDICDCILKDSINYLDHINGKNHQRNMGFSMKVKRSTIDDIRSKLASKKYEQSKEKLKTDDGEQDEAVKEEESKMADLRRQKKNQKKKAQQQVVEEEDETDNSELYSIMGLSGFGGSKKNN